MHSHSIRSRVFPLQGVRAKMHLLDMHHSVELWAFGAACALFLVLAGGLSWHLDKTEARALSASPVVKIQPMVDKDQWKKLSIAEVKPEIMKDLSAKAVPFNYSGQLPVARIDGTEINGKLPPAVWVKLEQPGVAILVIDTNAGKFVRVLQEVSPGFVSRCALRADEFGTMDGEPAELNRNDLVVKSMWLIQDAPAAAGQVPGWIAVSAPASADESAVVSK